MTAVLMAFGGGALLAALTIDLVGETLESGHFEALALGAVLGGFLLCDPRAPASPLDPIERNELFALHSWLTGAPSSASAVAVADISLWAIPRSDLDALILNAPELTQRIHRLLRSPQTLAYLVDRQGMETLNAQAWLDKSARTLLSSGRIPP